MALRSIWGSPFWALGMADKNQTLPFRRMSILKKATHLEIGFALSPSAVFAGEHVPLAEQQRQVPLLATGRGCQECLLQTETARLRSQKQPAELHFILN